MKKAFKTTLIIILIISFSCLSLFGCEKSCNQGEPSAIKNVIIIIGDGMGLEHVEAGEIYEDKNYIFNSWHKTTVNTDSINDKSYQTTDSAAGGTAIATGVLTKNGYVGKSATGENLETVLDVAKTLGKSTAVITTDKLYGATPASFTAHSLSRDNKVEIVESQINTSNVDILCGQYSGTINGYASLIAEYGYEYCTDFSKIDQNLDKTKHYWQFSLAGVDAEVELSLVVDKALKVLEKDEDGFVMMIEQAYIDKYSHSKDILGAVASVKSLNNTVETVMDFVGDRADTAVLITADHETGGLLVSKENFEGASTFTTLFGETAYYSYSSGSHTSTPVGLYIYGAKPLFKNLPTYKSESLIKNIETNTIIKNLILNK